MLDQDERPIVWQIDRQYIVLSCHYLLYKHHIFAYHTYIHIVFWRRRRKTHRTQSRTPTWHSLRGLKGSRGRSASRSVRRRPSWWWERRSTPRLLRISRKRARKLVTAWRRPQRRNQVLRLAVFRRWLLPPVTILIARLLLWRTACPSRMRGIGSEPDRCSSRYQ